MLRILFWNLSNNFNWIFQYPRPSPTKHFWSRREEDFEENK